MTLSWFGVSTAEDAQNKRTSWPCWAQNQSIWTPTTPRTTTTKTSRQFLKFVVLPSFTLQVILVFVGDPYKRTVTTLIYTMDLHSLSKFTSALTSLSMVNGTTMATKACLSSTRIEKSNAEEEVTDTKGTKLAAGKMADRTLLPYLLSTFQGLLEDYDSLDV